MEYAGCLGRAGMTSNSDGLDEQLRQSLKRLEADLARPVGITAEKQNDQIAYRFRWVFYWTCLIVAGGLAALGLLAGVVNPKNWADFNFYLLFAVPAVGFLGLGLASRYVLSGTQAFLKLLMRLADDGRSPPT